MARITTSARGEKVDFDLLAIQQALASAPRPIQVDTRQRFIEEKEGIKAKPVANAIKDLPAVNPALMMGIEAAQASASAGDVEEIDVSISEE